MRAMMTDHMYMWPYTLGPLHTYGAWAPAQAWAGPWARAHAGMGPAQLGPMRARA